MVLTEGSLLRESRGIKLPTRGAWAASTRNRCEQITEPASTQKIFELLPRTQCPKSTVLRDGKGSSKNSNLAYNGTYSTTFVMFSAARYRFSLGATAAPPRPHHFLPRNADRGWTKWNVLKIGLSYLNFNAIWQSRTKGRLCSATFRREAFDWVMTVERKVGRCQTNGCSPKCQRSQPGCGGMRQRTRAFQSSLRTNHVTGYASQWIGNVIIVMWAKPSQESSDAVKKWNRSTAKSLFFLHLVLLIVQQKRMKNKHSPNIL